MLSCPTWAESPITTSPYQGQTPAGLSNGLFRGLQRVLGINAMATWVAESQLQKQIHKKVDGDIDVNIIPYGASDLTQGKAKALKMKGKDLLIQKSLAVSQMTLETDKDTPIWLDVKSGKLKNPVGATIDATLSDADLAQTLSTPSIRQKLAHITIPLFGQNRQTLQLLNPQIHCLQDKFDLQGTLNAGTAQNATDAATNASTYPIHLQSQVALLNDGTRLGFPNLVAMPTLQADQPDLTSLFQLLLTGGIRPAKLVKLKPDQLQIQQLELSPGQLHVVAHIWLLPGKARKKG